MNAIVAALIPFAPGYAFISSLPTVRPSVPPAREWSSGSTVRDIGVVRFSDSVYGPRMKRGLAVAGVLLLLAAGAWVGWVLYEGGHLSRGGLIELARQSGPLAPLILMGLMVLAVVIGPIPTVPISIASGVVFGPITGFLYAMAGALLGAAISFRIARLVGRPFMQRFFRGHVAFCEACSSRLLFWVILGARLMPLVSFALVSYGAGLTAMGLSTFLFATAIGMVPMTILYLAVGASLTVAPLTAAIGGIAVVGLSLALPRLVERFNPFGLRDRMRHPVAPASPDSE